MYNVTQYVLPREKHQEVAIPLAKDVDELSVVQNVINCLRLTDEGFYRTTRIVVEVNNNARTQE